MTKVQFLIGKLELSQLSGKSRPWLVLLFQISIILVTYLSIVRWSVWASSESPQLKYLRVWITLDEFCWICPSLCMFSDQHGWSIDSVWNSSWMRLVYDWFWGELEWNALADRTLCLLLDLERRCAFEHSKFGHRSSIFFVQASYACAGPFWDKST